MAVNIDKKDMGYLGEEFQYRLIHHFFANKDFFKDISSILDQNMFTNPTLKQFVGWMKEHYKIHDTVPSYDIMGVMIRTHTHTDLDVEQSEAILNEIKNKPDEDPSYVEEVALKFFKQQHIVKTANEILRIAGNGDSDRYEKCAELLNEAIHQGVHNDEGIEVFSDIGEVLSDDYRIPIPTGILQLDKALEGGIGKGELGVIVGPTSFGKTSLTTAIASYASTCRCEANDNQGFKVLQIVFEDRIKQIQRKHLARIVTLNSGQVVESKDLSKPEFRELVRSTFETFADKDMMNANLRIIRLPNGDVTASQIKRLIKKLTNNGFKPDLVIVDYFECLDTNADAGYNVTNEWEKEGKTMRKFESMANELNIAMWIPSQGTKESISAELVTMDKMGGSVKKAQIAHIILSIARTTEDIENNKATMSILKNRSGKAGCIFKNVNFNNGTCVIECNDDEDMMTTIEFGMEKSNNIMKGTAQLRQEQRMAKAAVESYSAI